MLKVAVDVGEYQPLYKYLRERYTNRVVMTFAEIQAVLGFSLPGVAWVQASWWSGVPPHGRRSPQSDAWMLAGRTATVNLTARTVVFDMDTTQDSSSRKKSSRG
jgi:hypothetical protein